MVEVRTRRREMGQIVISNWDLENLLFKSMYDVEYGRYASRSGLKLPSYEVF
jgi:hypothetical protein